MDKTPRSHLQVTVAGVTWQSEAWLSGEALAAAVGIDPAILDRLKGMGLVEQADPDVAQFSAATAIRLRRMLRLHADLEVDLEAAAIIVDLLGRVERLERELNRQRAVSAAMSANVESRAVSWTSQSWSSRMPGVSITSTPEGATISSRCVVVWRPLPTAALMALVSWRSVPSTRLISVDFPTPDEPRSASVRPGTSHRASASRLSSRAALSATTGAPLAIDSTSARAPAGSTCRSDLLRTTTGCAPLSHASAR